jgi:Flp pilus assembly protein TadG
MTSRQGPGCRGEIPRRKSFLRRDGATLVEFALVASVVFLFVLAGIMFYGVLMTQNTLTAAAREGCRLASLPDVTSTATVIDAVEDRIERGGADPAWATIAVSPADMSNLDTGDEVSVSVSMPLSRSTWIQVGAILPDGNLDAEITYIRE